EQLGRAYSTDQARKAECLHTMMQLAEACDDLERLVNALTSLASVWIVERTPTAGLALLNRAVELARGLQMPSALIRPLSNTAAFHIGRDLDMAISAAEEALALATQAGMSAMTANAQGNLLVCYWIAGRWAQLRTLLADESMAC